MIRQLNSGSLCAKPLENYSKKLGESYNFSQRIRKIISVIVMYIASHSKSRNLQTLHFPAQACIEEVYNDS